MKRLRSLTGETVTINIRIGEQRLCVEEMVSFHSIKYTIGRGAVAEIYAGSAGKVLLAELPKIELERLLRNITLRKVAPHTITDKDVLLKELKISENRVAPKASRRNWKVESPYPPP
jgi:DNA-binding IclR family transcriptional regulator